MPSKFPYGEIRNQWDRENIRRIIETNINIDEKNRLLANEALHMAVDTKNYEIVNLLINKGVNINCESRLFRYLPSPLFRVLGSRADLKMVKFLIKKGVDIQNRGGYIPLMFHVIDGGNIAGANLLLEEGADIHAKDNYERTVLFMVMSEYSYKKDMVEFLLEKEVEIDSRDNNGETALFKAGKGYSFEAVKHLIDKGSNVNIQDNNGETLLHWSAKQEDWNRRELAKILIENGADCNLKNKDGMTPLPSSAKFLNFYVLYK